MFLHCYTVFVFKWCLFRIKLSQNVSAFSSNEALRSDNRSDYWRYTFRNLGETHRRWCFFFWTSQGSFLLLLFYPAPQNTKNPEEGLFISHPFLKKNAFWMLLLTIEPCMYVPVCVLMFISKTRSKQNMQHLYNARRYGTISVGWQFIYFSREQSDPYQHSR